MKEIDGDKFKQIFLELHKKCRPPLTQGSEEKRIHDEYRKAEEEAHRFRCEKHDEFLRREKKAAS